MRAWPWRQGVACEEAEEVGRNEAIKRFVGLAKDLGLNPSEDRRACSRVSHSRFTFYKRNLG